MKPFIIELNPYPIDVLVCIGEDTKSMHDYLSKQTENYNKSEYEPSESMNGLSFMSKNHGLVLWIRYEPEGAIPISILSHEILHIVFLLFNQVGVPISEDNSESCAYMVEFLTKQILITYSKNKNKRS